MYNNTEQQKLLKLSTASFLTPLSTTTENPWSPNEYDKLEIGDKDTFREIVEDCRFFYKKDPIAGTTIDKLVEIGINEIKFHKNGLSDNEIKVFEGIKPKLREFAESMALEFLLSGLVIPEINYTLVNKTYFQSYEVKRYDHLILPTSMWLRDPATIRINTPLLGDKPSYFMEVPEEMVYFIRHNGVYPDGTKDESLFMDLSTNFPNFVSKIKNGERFILLENDLIIRRKHITDSPYPVPYLLRALEGMKHKRNLRRMDYAIASRVIGAIQLFKLGSDSFPVTEEDGDEQFNSIKNQMYYRDTGGKDIERIFQLFANHTLNIEWVFPPTEALLDDAKYKDINQDIIYALGFPRILIVGESEKSNTSEAEFALKSPQSMMENFREKIIQVIREICSEISKKNGFKSEPIVLFEPLNLVAFGEFIRGLSDLYATGNLSRTSYADYFGYNFLDEIDQKEKEKKLLEQKGLDEFAPKPFSPLPKNNDKTAIPDKEKE